MIHKWRHPLKFLLRWANKIRSIEKVIIFPHRKKCNFLRIVKWILHFLHIWPLVPHGPMILHSNWNRRTASSFIFNGWREKNVKYWKGSTTTFSFVLRYIQFATLNLIMECKFKRTTSLVVVISKNRIYIFFQFFFW